MIDHQIMDVRMPYEITGSAYPHYFQLKSNSTPNLSDHLGPRKAITCTWETGLSVAYQVFYHGYKGEAIQRGVIIQSPPEIISTNDLIDMTNLQEAQQQVQNILTGQNFDPVLITYTVTDPIKEQTVHGSYVLVDPNGMLQIDRAHMQGTYAEVGIKNKSYIPLAGYCASTLSMPYAPEAVTYLVSQNINNSSLKVDLNRMFSPSSPEALAHYEKIFPEGCSPQSLQSPLGHLSIAVALHKEHGLIMDPTNNHFSCFMQAFSIPFSDQFLFDTKPTDGSYPVYQSTPKLWVRLLKPEEEKKQWIYHQLNNPERKPDYLIPGKSGAYSIYNNTPLGAKYNQHTVYPLEHMMVHTTDAQVGFVAIETLSAANKALKSKRQAYKEKIFSNKEARKGSMVECLKSMTTHYSASELSTQELIDPKFIKTIGKQLGAKLKLPRLSPIQTVSRYQLKGSVENSEIHYLGSYFDTKTPALMSIMTERETCEPLIIQETSNTVSNIIKSNMTFKGPQLEKSRASLILVALIILMIVLGVCLLSIKPPLRLCTHAAIQLLKRDKKIWGGILLGAGLISGLLLYCGNWIHHMINRNTNYIPPSPLPTAAFEPQLKATVDGPLLEATTTTPDNDNTTEGTPTRT